jgi:hypothetical protein
MGWGYWKYSYIPQVDTWKWQDARRMTNICERWSKNHTNALQYALFNGDGFEAWENVWGESAGSYALRFLGWTLFCVLWVEISDEPHTS